MFRSLPVQYYQLVMPRESAWSIMNTLGYLDHDPEQPLINRPFANYVKRCDDLLLKLSQILKQAEALNLLKNYRKGSAAQFMKFPATNSHTELNRVEEFIQKRVASFQEHQRSYEQLQEQMTYLQNYEKILKECRRYLGETLFRQEESSKFDYFVGVVSHKEKQQFLRVVFRITKGNAITEIVAIDDQKYIFIVVFPNQGQFIKNKLQKLCDTISAGKFPIPTTAKEFEGKLAEVVKKCDEIQHLVAMTHQQLSQCIIEFLSLDSGMSTIEKLRLFLLKEKDLYSQLNKLKMQGHLFIGELWVPKESVQDLELALQKAKESNPNLPSGQLAVKVVPPLLRVPTLFKVNSFTAPFQQIVNTYGVPRYQEINPAFFTLVTFPFLFGVMFGDIGHGFLLFLFGIIQCFAGEPPFHEYRYLITLMGFFSFYSGWIYNDYLSLSLNAFGSCYLIDGQLSETKKPDCNYPFGIDPAWGGNLEFGDSVKMKFSVIVAFFHMGLGLAMLGANLLHRSDGFGFVNKFLPQMIFLVCTIGYMDFLIFYKWMTPFTAETAPSIINTMIAMALQFGAVDGLPMWNKQSQETIQLILILIAIGCVPWMWLPNILKSYFSSSSHKQTADYGKLVEEPQLEIQMQEFTLREGEEVITSPVEVNLLDTSQNSVVSDSSHEFSEIFVHETIEMIEFVLGVISNTASYLRLWALSLAHSQLAEVFYELALSEDVEFGYAFALIVGYVPFALATFGVLMCMDTMECFLHSLRLHWVEFQNKFYKGDGVEFEVYSFKVRLEIQ